MMHFFFPGSISADFFSLLPLLPYVKYVPGPITIYFFLCRKPYPPLLLLNYNANGTRETRRVQKSDSILHVARYVIVLRYHPFLSTCRTHLARFAANFCVRRNNVLLAGQLGLFAIRAVVMLLHAKM